MAEGRRCLRTGHISPQGICSPEVMEGLLEQGVEDREEVEQAEDKLGGGMPLDKRKSTGAAPPSTREPAATVAAARTTYAPG